MDNLTKLRIVLTIGAIVGFLPITLLFTAGVVGLLIPLFFIVQDPPLAVLVGIGVFIISSFAIWSAWKIYALSMAASPVVRYTRLLSAGAVTAMIWGMLLAYYMRELPELTYIFLMPGIISTAMLAFTLRRARS
ncbi:hypothetical protein [Pseudomonas sp. NPDC089569]|uniref:hypothetical protein n=1 Tax=Pseudomonas sp. NPDC089569 TaxID=3390722 RepID=UPI003CFD5477